MSLLSSKECQIAIAVGSFVAGAFVVKLFQKEESLLPPTASTNVSKKSTKNYSVASYILDVSLREPNVLRELREHTKAKVQMSRMLSDPVQCQLFRLLLNMLDAKKCIEVGTYTGYNALSTALTLPEDGVVYALDVSEDFVRHGYEFFEKANVRDKIVVKIAPALETLDQLIADGGKETFDFIYIDADKENYGKYLDRALCLLRVGGIAALGNTLLGGRVMNLDDPDMEPSRKRIATVMHDLNKKLRLDNRFQLTFLNIVDGVTLCCKI